MPLLMNIATVNIGKQKIADGAKGLFSIRRTLPNEKLTLANKLRTTVTVADESNLGKLILPSTDSKGIFAGWCRELDRVAANDLYKSEPLNKVKDTKADNLRKQMLEENYKNWLAEVNARMEKLGFKK